MKRIVSVCLLVLVALVCLIGPVKAEPGVQNGDSLAIVHPAGGAYVIVTKLEGEGLNFKYGWNNSKQFETLALGYWIGVYDVTASGYVWSFEEEFDEPNPKMIKLISAGTGLVSGHEYYINFFVRDRFDAMGHGTSNVVEIVLLFTAP